MNDPQRDFLNSADYEAKVGSIHNNYVSGVLTDDQRLAAELLAEYLPDFLSNALDWSKIGSENTVYVDDSLKSSILDLAFTAPYKGGDNVQRFVIAVEHKSALFRRLAFQLLGYCWRVSANYYANGLLLPDGRSPWPLPVVLYNGPKEMKKLPTMRDAVGAWKGSSCAEEFEDLYLPMFKYVVIDLASMKIEELRGRALLRTFLEVLKRATNGTLIDAFRNLRLPWNLKKFDWSAYTKLELQNFFKRTIRYVDCVARNTGERIDAECYRDSIHSVKDTRIKGEMKTFIDEFIEEGIEKGIERGIEKGIEKGQAKSIYSSIERYLDKHFGAVPQRLVEKIEDINDYPALEKIQYFSWDAKSLTEVANFVDEVALSLKEESEL